MTPRVVAFVGGPLGQHLLTVLREHLVAVVTDDGTGMVDWLSGAAATPEQLAFYKPTHGISVGYRHILSPDVLAVFPCGVANVHTALLPYGRGAHPNAWAIYDNDPAGVTLHLVDRGVDTGAILWQEPVEVRGDDTAATLYARLMKVAGNIIRDHLIHPGSGLGWMTTPEAYPPQRQPAFSRLTRRKAELEMIRVPDTEHAHLVMDALRARTFAPHPGALYVGRDGKRYRVRVEIVADEA